MSAGSITTALPGLASGPVEEGCIRVGAIMQLTEVLSGFEIGLGAVLTRLGHPQHLFGDPENTIAMRDLGALLERCVALTGCQHLGLLLGQSIRLEGLGLLGELLPHCTDVRTALACFQNYNHLHDRGGMTTCSVEGDTAILGYTLLAGPFPGSDQIQDTVLAMGVAIMRGLCGARWRPRSALLARRRPDDLRPYQRLLECPLDTNAESTSLAFPCGDLDIPVAGTDPAKFRVLSECLEYVHSHHGLGFMDRVRRVVHALVALRRCSVDAVASYFALSRRSLNRRLESEGGSVRQIVDEVRCALATRLLADTDLPVAQIAAILDYSYPSAFNHAFERWYGMSPRHWRRKHVAVRRQALPAAC